MLNTKLAATLALLLVIGASRSLSVYAHKLDTDSGTGAVIHLDPDDSPLAGRPTAISWEFAEDSDVKVTECKCELEIYRASDLKRSINSGSTDVLAENIAAYTYTFPEAGEYKLILKGEPSGEVEFENFKLEYYTTVSADAAVNATVDWALMLGVILVGSVTLAAIAMLVNSARKQP